MNKKEMVKIQGSQEDKGVRETKEKDSQGEREKGGGNTEEVTEEVAEEVSEEVHEEVTEVVSPPISRYYQKQYERFMKVTEKKEDIQEAFFESIPGEKYEDDTLYTRLKRNPRKRH